MAGVTCRQLLTEIERLYDDLLADQRQASSVTSPLACASNRLRTCSGTLDRTFVASTLTPAPGSPDMQPAETSLEFIKRMSHAIEDWDALESI